MSQVIQLKFSRGDRDRMARRSAEVRAIDIDTGLPVAALPVKAMDAWLKQHGFQWRCGTDGIWERAA